MTDDLDTKQIWKSLSSAISIEMREATSIRGSSGQGRPVQAVAVDDKTNRVVIFSAEPSPRIAALMQTDVQATLPDVHVLVARPVIFDLSEIARRVAKQTDIHALATLLTQMSTKQKKRAQQSANDLFSAKLGPAIKPLFDTATRWAALFCAGIGYRRADCKCGLDVNFPQDADDGNLPQHSSFDDSNRQCQRLTAG